MRRLVALSLLLSACHPETSGSRDTDPEPQQAIVPPPDADGPYRVGYRAWELPYTPPVGPDRTITLHAWYPTLATEGEVGRYGVYTEATGTLLEAPPATADDPLRPHPDGRPLWVHSHGDQAYGGAASGLFRHAAAHGWVVLSADHVDNMLFANASPTPALHWVHRPADLTAMVDALDALDASDPLAGIANTSRYLVSGHSRGGTTVWALLGAPFEPPDTEGDPVDWCPGCDPALQAQVARTDLSDPRATAGLLLATGVREGLYGATGVLEVDAPIQLMTGSEDGDGGARAWEQIDGLSAVWVKVDGGCHETFSLGTPCGTLEAEEGFDLVRPHLLAFGRYHLLGDDDASPWLDGTITAGDAITVQNRP